MRALPVVFSLLAVAAGAAEIRVAGSDLLGEGFTRAVAEFARQNDTVVKLELHGTQPAGEELAAGRADVGLFLLPAGEPPPNAVTSRVMAYQVAVVAVPTASPLTQVTVAQLRGIFGESARESFTRWGELNLLGEWSARPIALRALSPKGGLAFPLFERVVLSGAATKAVLEFSGTAAALVERLRAADNTIGVTGAFPAEPAGLRVLALAAGPAEPAFGPTPENVHRGGYPLRLPLYVAFRRTAAPELLLFLKFLLSDETAAVLGEAHFVPLPVGVRNQLVFELEGMK